MGKKHLYIALAQVKPGAILAEELLDKIGHVLLPAGTKLTAAMLQAIGNHHIHQLSIQDLGNADTVVINQEDAQQKKIQQLERLNHLFRHESEDGPTKTLRTYIEKYRQGDPS